MSYNAKERLHRCDLCRRPMNPTDRLTDMYRPSDRTSIGICPAAGCWEQANADGYMSRHQATGEVALSDGTYYRPE